MERFKVDGEELRRHYPPETKLQRVFSDIERELQAESRVVCRFIVNGLTLEERDEPRYAGWSLDEVKTLEYLSEEQGQVIDEVLQSWIEALPEVMRNGERLAFELRERKKMEGRLKDFHDLVENCEFLIGSLIALRATVGDSGSAFLIEWDRIEALTRTSVGQILAAFEKQDLVQLSELIEYDLNHCLECWRGVLVGIQAARNGGAGPNDGDVERKNQPDPLGGRGGAC